METLIIILAGILVMIATYLFLSKNLIRVILGSAIFSHAAHLLIITMGGLKTGSVPIVGEKPIAYTDALPQALILTSIVIGFAVTALFLVLAYRTYRKVGSDQLDGLRGVRDE
ncbi:Na(+)/H(+) antiporter subunit C [Lederbergia sp. NSJ-179]|uniref:Na(+)/H(+) antiporter subunit C n=1 Tax=Lederbergia sp. NSJ-179 TaxID=2931402 RepID=UPI001FD29D10|nr:Na(+)/H(+) antiporter subunit C [Lederbergia sp. NSJ-179]MCJ7840085.1 Na(+)/H(+) antiporter subunit C [Lederbergia sp. NSJ-179]